MKKVGIITLNGNFNYGNKLQNYALQKVLEKNNFDVETLWIDITYKKGFKAQVLVLLSSIKQTLLRHFGKNEKNNSKDLYAMKVNNFVSFSRKYLNENHSNFNIKKLEKISNSFDYFIVGSDQVWNPHFLGEQLSIYLLEFAPTEKRLSYAASFGISKLPEEYVAKYKNSLSNFKAISVREKAGVKILQDIAAITSELVLDPTMLLDCTEWRKISKSTDRVVKNNYLLTYYLGDLPLEYQQYINKVAEEKNLEIINIGSISNEDIYKLDPSGFLNLIDNCEIFFTDSFHGCVFSILFEKPFVVFERQGGIGMYSRIETLLEDFLLKERAYKNINDENLFKIDYKRTNDILQDKRINSMNFLVNNIK